MKKLIALLMLVGSLNCLADTIKVVLPSNTKRVISSDFSSGGGKKTIIYLEVLVELDDGTYAMYLDSTVSAAGLIGYGRYVLPDKFTYTIDTTGKVKNEIKVDWD